MQDCIMLAIAIFNSTLLFYSSKIKNFKNQKLRFGVAVSTLLFYLAIAIFILLCILCIIALVIMPGDLA